MDKKVHYKMHKVKKQWVTIAVTGMSLGAVSAVSLGTNDGVVQADEHTDATVAIPDITVDTGTVSNDTTAAQDPTTAVAATNDVATDQATPTATFDLTTDTTNTVAANAVDTVATVGTDRAATTNDTTATIDTAVDTTNYITTTDTTTEAKHTYNAILGFESAGDPDWAYRKFVENEDQGIKSKDYDCLTQYMATNTGKHDASMTNAKIDKDGTYTVTVDNLDFSKQTSINMAYVITDIPAAMKGVEFTNVKYSVDG